mmetsp:Transcript_42455/g.92624  ORF Transcript_42455/g.92624 Transcript_42455/m.92624 type:complete len:655 (+) Transcript_42455:45-2009(+)
MDTARRPDDGLFAAVKLNNQASVVEALNYAPIDTYWHDEEVHMRTPLRIACFCGHIRLVHLFLQRGAKAFAGYDKDRWSALHSAAVPGHDAVLRAILCEAEDVHDKFAVDGFELLHTCTELLNPKLVDGGADFLQFVLKYTSCEPAAPAERLGFVDHNALHLCCLRGKMKSAVALLRHGVDINLRTGEFYLQSRRMNAVAQSSGVVSCSVEPGLAKLPVEVFDEGLLPIHLAAFGGHVRTLQVLSRMGQSESAVTLRHQWTPLMFAVWRGNAKMVRELCRTSSRKVINNKDRRTDSEWTPLTLAVARADLEIVQTLLAYGADPLVRVKMSDFPGRSFMKHVSAALHAHASCPDCAWSTADERISLLHIAVARGEAELIRFLLPIVRGAHWSPIGALAGGSIVAPAAGSTVAAKTVNLSYIGGGSGGDPPKHAARVQDQVDLQDRFMDAPVDEGFQDDPVAFSTRNGFSPAGLALILAVVDPKRHVQLEFVENFPTAINNTRHDAFVELLRTGKSFRERTGRPPVLPQRFRVVCETLVMQCMNEFAETCEKEGMLETLYGIAHLTLCAAARGNRMRVAGFLLERSLANPRCQFIHPIEHRPLHVACGLGFGNMAQLLIDHNADPSESDGRGRKPVEVLTSVLLKRLNDAGVTLTV